MPVSFFSMIFLGLFSLSIEYFSQKTLLRTTPHHTTTPHHSLSWSPAGPAPAPGQFLPTSDFSPGRPFPAKRHQRDKKHHTICHHHHTGFPTQGSRQPTTNQRRRRRRLCQHLSGARDHRRWLALKSPPMTSGRTVSTRRGNSPDNTPLLSQARATRCLLQTVPLIL